MKKIFFICLFLLTASPLFAEPRALVTEKLIDLGKLAEDRIYEYKFSVKNVGDSDLIVKVEKPSCSCTKILQPKAKQQLAPETNTHVKFTFDTTGMWGQVVKYIYIRTNDPKNPAVRIMINANVATRKDVILHRFKSFGAGTIVGAGLIDGVNPCAFTVLVFFVSFLSFVGYNRKQIFTLGSFFILTVFLTYLGIGLGLFEFFRRLEIFRFLSHLIFYITAILAFVLGIFSLYDWWIFKKTKDPDKIKLKLPGVIKRQIQNVIRQKTDDRTEDPSTKDRSVLKIIFTAVSCGFIISLLESVCTGQLYFPTIVFVLGIPALRVKAFSYLLLYNLMFIVPLLIIFVLAIVGVRSEGFAKIARMHLAKVKLLTAIVFFALGFSLLFFVKK